MYVVTFLNLPNEEAKVDAAICQVQDGCYRFFQPISVGQQTTLNCVASYPENLVCDVFQLKEEDKVYQAEKPMKDVTDAE